MIKKASRLIQWILFFLKNLNFVKKIIPFILQRAIVGVISPNFNCKQLPEIGFDIIAVVLHPITCQL
jgi:hypothetical protein